MIAQCFEWKGDTDSASAASLRNAEKKDRERFEWAVKYKEWYEAKHGGKTDKVVH